MAKSKSTIIKLTEKEAASILSGASTSLTKSLRKKLTPIAGNILEEKTLRDRIRNRYFEIYNHSEYGRQCHITIDKTLKAVYEQTNNIRKQLRSHVITQLLSEGITKEQLIENTWLTQFDFADIETNDENNPTC
jgi:hypothetical protein